MTRFPPNDHPTPDAMARATRSTDQIFPDAGLDQNVDSDAYTSVESWFARWNTAIEAMSAGKDDGCPCAECRAQFGPLDGPKAR